jgi:hypothetical protein
MIAGCLIGESMRVGAVFGPERLRIRRITRQDVSAGVSAPQPPVWTVIDFEADDDADADALAAGLAESLAAEGGWYADFRVGDEHVVVYANKVFRYTRGDSAGRSEAVAYGRTVGVPEHQLDWKD